ncbi:TonB-dependent receptor [Spongiibacter marinus]|uniref:TonB-dependent receptor n=1 Tax=Spongiibacter marinus TaxID=354246 RepID=UPI0035BE88DA
MTIIKRQATLRVLIPTLAGVTIAGVPESFANTTGKRAVLEEVVVTARRRSENLQETPVAVSAISGDDMREQGLTTTADLTRSVPSLQIGKASTTQIFIRGIGERTGFSRVDPGVGVYLNGLYIPRVDGQLFDTVNLKAVQVLRGPQGSLFGKNTTGGAMLLTLQEPAEERSGFIEGGIGSFELLQGKAGFSLPLSDSLRASWVLAGINDEGFLEDKATGEHFSSNNRHSFIAQLQWDASESITNDSFLYYGKIDEKRPGRSCEMIDENALLVKGLQVAWPGDTNPGDLSAFRENCEKNPPSLIEKGELSLGKNPQADYEYQGLTLGNSTAWAITDDYGLKLILGIQDAVEKPNQVSDSDGGPADFLETSSVDDSDRRIYSAELQFNGSALDSHLNYTTGLYWLKESITDSLMTFTSLLGFDALVLAQLGLGQYPDAPPLLGTLPVVGALAGPVALSQFQLNNEARGAYFQGSYDFTNNLQWTLGIRYTEEERATDLVYTGADMAAISAVISAHPLFGPAVPGVTDGLHPFLGPWALDPVQIAMNLFPDNDSDGVPDFPLDHAAATRQSAGITFYETSPMTSLAYVLPEAWLDDSWINAAMVYGTWSNGFKSGFFEPRGADGLVFIKPERVENIELGFKIDAFERSVRVNGALYQMRYDNIQLIQVDTDSENNLAVTMDNAGAATIEGVELEATWLPLPGMMINAAFSYNAYDFTQFSDRDLLALAVTGEKVEIDRTNESFPVVPETTFFLGAQYDFETGFGTLTPRFDMNYKSDIYYGIDNKAWLAYQRDKELAGTPAFVTVNVRLMWRSPQGSTTVTAYLRNVTDEVYPEGGSATAETLGNKIITPGAPRAWGLEFRREFY